MRLIETCCILEAHTALKGLAKRVDCASNPDSRIVSYAKL